MLWERIDLGDNFERMFPDQETFWESNKSLKEIYEALKRLQLSSDSSSELSFVDPLAVAAAINPYSPSIQPTRSMKLAIFNSILQDYTQTI